MKTLLMALALLTTQSFANSNDPIVSVESGSSMLSLNGLRCSLVVGVESESSLEDRLWTILGSSEHDARGLGFIRPQGVDIKLTHTFAQTKGCPIKELDLVRLESNMRFGFIDAPLTLTKRDSGPFINGFGKCVRRVHEKLEIQLSSNIIITSNEGQLVETSGCE